MAEHRFWVHLICTFSGHCVPVMLAVYLGLRAETATRQRLYFAACLLVVGFVALCWTADTLVAEVARG